MVTPPLCAIAFTPPGDTSPRAVTSVPASPGACELQIRTGMSRSIAGWMVLGCSTLAPKYASSAASAYDKLDTVRAPGTTRGSAVSRPLTGVEGDAVEQLGDMAACPVELHLERLPLPRSSQLPRNPRMPPEQRVEARRGPAFVAVGRRIGGREQRVGGAGE